MRWITHQTGAILAGLALGLSLPPLAAASAGAIFPDVIDQKLSGLAPTKRSRQKVFNRIHRGPSHWFGWWLLLFLASVSIPLPMLWRDILLGFSLGCLSHVGMDLLTPRGVPLLPFTRQGKIALPVCSTGTATETIFLLLLIAGALFWFRDAPFLQSLGRYF